MTRLEEIPAYKLAKVPPKTTISSKNKMTITIITPVTDKPKI